MAISTMCGLIRKTPIKSSPATTAALGSRVIPANLAQGFSLPVGQFYHVSVDMAIPITSTEDCKITAIGLADSSYPGGVTNHRWENLYGGDGFFALPDPSDRDYVYVEAQGGTISRESPHA